MIEINPKVFYISGVICFGLVAVCSLINYFIYFETYNLYSKIGTLASVVFNFMLFGFFYWLLKSQTSGLPKEDPNDIQADLEEFNK